jgi:hypothetical protein
MPQDPLLPQDVIVVYGVDTCEDTTRARERLSTAGVPFRYVRLDRDRRTKATLVAAGYGATPVIVAPVGPVLLEPDDAALDRLIAALAA